MPSVFGDQVGAMMDTFTMETPVHQVGTTVQKGWLIIVTCAARLQSGCCGWARLLLEAALAAVIYPACQALLAAKGAMSGRGRLGAGGAAWRLGWRLSSKGGAGSRRARRRRCSGRSGRRTDARGPWSRGRSAAPTTRAPPAATARRQSRSREKTASASGSVLTASMTPPPESETPTLFWA